MPKTIEFNTGRMYGPEGQFIKATLHEDGVCTFMDHSRGIDGEFPYPGQPLSESGVMAGYDGNRYASTQRSRKDGTSYTGCNKRVG